MHSLEGIKLQELKYSFYIMFFLSAQLIAINVPQIFLGSNRNPYTPKRKRLGHI